LGRFERVVIYSLLAALTVLVLAKDRPAAGNGDGVAGLMKTKGLAVYNRQGKRVVEITADKDGNGMVIVYDKGRKYQSKLEPEPQFKLIDKNQPQRTARP
jgi:uncharacterized membrane protein YdfJ with MMPL/SSD domain